MFPYIGITDFTEFSQVEEMLRVLRSTGVHRAPGRMLHVGVMMSFKTLHDIPTKWQNAFPPKRKVASIFSSDATYNCLHYADYDHNPLLAQSLAQAIAWGGPGIHALQLDMPWPDPLEIVEGVKSAGGNLEVILQVGKVALEEVDEDPLAMVEHLQDYNGVIHRVLLDKSMGRGLGMDAMALLPFARAIREHLPTLGLGAAGGLGPETVYLVEPLAHEFPNLSIDAQGRLRPSGNALDPIDWDMAGTYLRRALALFAH